MNLKGPENFKVFLGCRQFHSMSTTWPFEVIFYWYFIDRPLISAV